MVSVDDHEMQGVRYIGFAIAVVDELTTLPVCTQDIKSAGSKAGFWEA